MKKPLRIGLIMQGGGGWIGGSEYIKNIILALGTLPDDVRSTFEVCLISNHPLDENLVDEIKPHVKTICQTSINLDPYTLEEISIQPKTLLRRVINKLTRNYFKPYNPRFNAFLESQKLDFVYPYFTLKNTNTSYKTAAWIYDFQHKYLPEYFTDYELEVRDNSFERMVENSSTVVVSSKAAELDLQKFFPEAVNKSKVLSFRTIPLPKWYELDPVEVQKKYHLPDRFFLISNQFWQHKNHLIVFEALKILHSKSIYPIVVCTGRLSDYRNASYSDTILQTIHTLGIAHQVHLLGLIPKNDQVQLLRRAISVIQPSLFEGWNTTVEDARVFGKTLILSDIAVHQEQNPPNSHFFNANSPENLAQVMADLWQNFPMGPDLAEERLARNRSVSEIQNFAKTFLEICQ